MPKQSVQTILNAGFIILILNAPVCVTFAQSAESDNSDVAITENDAAISDHEIDVEEVEKIEPAAVFDIDQLVERMKETDAIGFLTKLSLKNKVDDLLEQAEGINVNSSEDQKAQLKESFDGLILKTVTLLNKGEDYTLAEDIYSAQEQLWNSILENKA